MDTFEQGLPRARLRDSMPATCRFSEEDLRVTLVSCGRTPLRESYLSGAQISQAETWGVCMPTSVSSVFWFNSKGRQLSSENFRLCPLINTRFCHVKENADLVGDTREWGEKFIVPVPITRAIH